MTQSFQQPGKILTLVAPYDRASSGLGAKVGAFFGVSTKAVLSGAEGEFETEGVHGLAKTASQAWSQGDRIYWDDSNKRCDSDSSVGMFIGVATEAVAGGAGDTTGYVKLASATELFEGAQAAVADLTDNSGGATADGTIGAVTNPTLSDWNGSSVYPSAAQATAIGAAFTALKDAVKELSTKQNALLAKLRLAGIIDP